MAGPQGRCDGWRPWAWWAFEAGEQRPDPDGETVRLAQLGELTAEELAVLREEALEARLRIGTDSELISNGTSLDQRAVQLAEAVERALDRQAA